MRLTLRTQLSGRIKGKEKVTKNSEGEEEVEACQMIKEKEKKGQGEYR